jgi:hypothetical protein
MLARAPTTAWIERERRLASTARKRLKTVVRDWLELNQKPEIAQIISSGLLYDEPANPIMNDFDPTFPNGQPVPLECN